MGTPIPCSVFACSPCLPVGGAGCALLGGLGMNINKLNLTVLGKGVDRVKILHPFERRGGSSGKSSLDRVYTWAVSQSRLYLKVMLDLRAF